MAIDVIDYITDFLFRHQFVDQLKRTIWIVGKQIGKLCPAWRCFHHGMDTRTGFITRRNARLNLGMQTDRPVAKRQQDFLHITKDHSLPLLTITLERHVIETENDILRRHDDRLSVCRAENVVGRHHQHPRFKLRLERQRHVNSHLVTIKIGVESGTDKRVKLDCLTLYQHRLKRLNAKPVKRRRTVQHDRVLANYLFQNIPDLGSFLLDHPFGHLHGTGHPIEFEFRIDEGLEQLQRHFLWQATLMQLKFRSNHDHRTA